jgi:hypothetical protein
MLDTPTQDTVVIRDPQVKQPKNGTPALVQVIQAFTSVFKRRGRKMHKRLFSGGREIVGSISDEWFGHGSSYAFVMASTLR